jgi:GDP/UDP-N,N'-diacetylbacillosamine 2-epimerase (hydrolysing)
MSRKICVVTGTRAEYGLLRWVMEGICQKPELKLQIVATGMHLSPEFGLTYREIEKDGFHIDRKLEMLLSSDTPVGLAKSMGLGLIGFGEVFQELQPDLILMLGDRYEIFSAASAAMVARIPIVHLHGGESSEGAFDEAIRHSVTKMSHLHFVATETYRKRVVRLGENPDRVFNVGAMAIDNFRKLKLLSRKSLETELNFKLGKRNLLVTFHPVTLERETSGRQLEQLLKALDGLQDTHIIFTGPNADTDGRNILELIKGYVSKNKEKSLFVTSLGTLKYLSAMKYMDGVVGNSSSGLIEAPSLQVGTINIGDRQRGRIRAESVIDCEPNIRSLNKAFQILYSKGFQEKLVKVVNPYGTGGSAKKIVNLLKSADLKNILKKNFYDVKV